MKNQKISLSFSQNYPVEDLSTGEIEEITVEITVEVTVETVKNNKIVIFVVETKNSKTTKENASKEVSSEISSSKLLILPSLKNRATKPTSLNVFNQTIRAFGGRLQRNFSYRATCFSF